MRNSVPLSCSPSFGKRIFTYYLSFNGCAICSVLHRDVKAFYYLYFLDGLNVDVHDLCRGEFLCASEEITCVAYID